MLSWIKAWMQEQSGKLQTEQQVSMRNQSPHETLEARFNIHPSSVPATQETIACLRQEIQHHIELRDVICSIHRSLAIDELQHCVVQEFLQFFEADWVFLLERGQLNWQPVQTSCLSVEYGPSLHAYLAQETVASRLHQSHPIVLNPQTSQQPLNLPKQWLEDSSESWLLVPIHLPQEGFQSTNPWGLVAIGRKTETSGWTLEQQKYARLLTDEIEVAIKHSRQHNALQRDNHKLKSLASTDSLTGLANRRQFDTYFTGEWQRLAREKQPLTLVLCDIDYFKLYNDNYGHPTGDICLTQVSRMLMDCIRRPADLVARYGGEEFAVVLPNTDTSGGHNVALAIQQALAQAAIPHTTSPISDAVTLTMGIATVVPKHHFSPHDLLQAADLALYHAKQQGRDRIYVHAHYCIHDNDGDASDINACYQDNGDSAPYT